MPNRIMSMKNSVETVVDRTRDLPACSSEPQPNEPPSQSKENLGYLSVDVSIIVSPF